MSVITHFDEKFFQAVGLLLRKPVTLSKQYVPGRKVAYLLSPIYFTFIFFLVLIGLSKLQDRLYFDGTGSVYGLLVVLGIYCAFKAMRNFYLHSGSKTMVKFLLFNFLRLNSLGFRFPVSPMVSLLRS